MIFKQEKMGGDRNLGYLIGDENTNEAAIIDPAYNPEILINLAKEKNLINPYPLSRPILTLFKV